MADLKALLTRHGLVLSYEHDRAAIDTGLHLFLEGEGVRRTSQFRVWFQAKSKRAKTLPLEIYQAADSVEVRVKVDHIRFWAAAPEPVYLVVYVESAGEFIAEDVRDIVERQWPRGNFYSAIPLGQCEVSLRVATSKKLDEVRAVEMLQHRSMRIDGPAFRGRPLGHHYDPIRSQIACPASPAFERLIESLLAAHDFRVSERIDVAQDIGVFRGRLYETLSWQSPAFAEYGYGPDDDFRSEPSYETLHGKVFLIVDRAIGRKRLADAERAMIAELAEQHGEPDTSFAVIFNGCDLSGTGGLWRSALRDLGVHDSYAQVRQVGVEAVTFLLLVTTLVYLDFAPEIAWDHINYLYTG
ncbi:hypothetical protein ACLQ27_30225 [Micromonospora sp. DT63]